MCPTTLNLFFKTSFWRKGNLTEHMANTISHLQRFRQGCRTLSKHAHDTKPRGGVDMLESRDAFQRALIRHKNGSNGYQVNEVQQTQKQSPETWTWTKHNSAEKDLRVLVKQKLNMTQ